MDEHASWRGKIGERVNRPLGDKGYVHPFECGYVMESLDRVFDVLSKERRRYVLYYLDQANEPVDIDELTEKIIEWESSSEELDDDAFDDVYLSLTHHHLPKAAHAKYIEYDPEQHSVEITGEPSEFKIILSISEVLEQPSKEGIVDISDLSPSEFFEQMSSQ